jgi:hypothetical protein
LDKKFSTQKNRAQESKCMQKVFDKQKFCKEFFDIEKSNEKCT